MSTSRRSSGVSGGDDPIHEELFRCTLGRIVLYRKGRFRELRYEVRRPNAAKGEAQYRRALNFEEHKLLKMFMCHAYLQ